MKEYFQNALFFLNYVIGNRPKETYISGLFRQLIAVQWLKMASLQNS